MCKVYQAAALRERSGSRSQQLMPTKKYDIEGGRMILDGQDLVKETLATATKIKDLTKAVIIAVVVAMTEAPVTERSVQHVMVATKMAIFSSLTSQDPWCHTNSLRACKIAIFQICTSSTKNIKKTIHKTMRRLF